MKTWSCGLRARVGETAAGRGGRHQVEDGIAQPSAAMSINDLLAVITQMRAADVEEPIVEQ